MGSRGRWTSADEEMMEQTNQSMAESLSMKVGQLKNLAIDLDTEARDHLPLLDGVGDEMDTGSLRLGGTSGRLRNIGRMHGLSGRKMTCYFGLAVTTFMVVVYYFLLPMAWK